MSAVLFVLTCFVYPLAAASWARIVPAATLVTLALFFVPFELTYEILYDLRDLAGDRAEGIPTYPVVHGALASRRIIDALLALSAIVLAGGFVARVLGARELLMLAAPLAQLAFYRPRFRRGLTTRDCVVLTHLGTGMLVLFLIGTAVWLWAGLPANVMLGST
jgi:4-hydroxybenzoate polyprenyltransferase